MPLSERSRAALYEALTTIVDDQEAVQEMLSQFPSRDVDEYVTKGFLRAEMTELRTGLQSEISALRLELHAELRRQLVWTISTMIALANWSLSILILAWSWP